jgi:hypothetical protein
MGRHFAFRISAVACAVLAAALWAGPYILRPDLFANDAAQHTFWLYRYADPSLFPGDLTARFFSFPASAPWGYRGLFAVIAPVFDVLSAGEWIAAMLFLASAWLGWAIGAAVVDEEWRHLGGLVGVLAVAWLVSLPADAMSPLALQRSFALPLTLLALWAMIRGRHAWLGVTWLLSALIYPVIIVVLGLAGGVMLLIEMLRKRGLPPAFAWNFIAGVSAIALVIAAMGYPADIGPTLSGAEAMALPEFGEHGRLRLGFGTFTVRYFHSHLLGLGWSPSVVIAIAGAVAVALLLRGRRAIPLSAWVLLCCGLSVWFASQHVLFDLYLPNRHARWAIAAFAVAALPAAAVALVQWLVRGRARSAAVDSDAAAWGAGGLAIVLVAALWVPKAARVWQSPVDVDMENAYVFLRSLPRDTLVAAHPDVADFIPLRARLSVLASTETSLSFMAGYYQSLVPRLRASFDAAYADSWRALDERLAPYGVDVMVTSPYVWQQSTYFAPFDTQVRRLLEAGQQNGFVLRKPPEDRVLFRSGEVYVVKVGGVTRGR